MKEIFVWGRPYTATIEPTNFCNLKCPECPSGLGRLTRPLGSIDIAKFEKYCQEIHDSVFYLQLFFQGEPLVNKNIHKLVEVAHKYNMYVAISTNGILINQKIAENLISSKIDKIIFSIDGLDDKTYQNYRVGGTFQKAFDGFQTILKEKLKTKSKYPFIEFQFIVMKQNEHQIKDVLKLNDLKGVNKVTLKTMQVYTKESAKYYLPTLEKYSRYIIDENGELRLKGDFKNRCFAIWRTIVISWDGRVVSCCFDKDGFTNLGDLNKDTLHNIWKGKKFNNFRKAIIKNRAKIPICKNCTEGIKININ